MIHSLVDLFENWLGWPFDSRHILRRYLVTPRHNPFVFQRELRRDIHRRLRYLLDREIPKGRYPSQ